MPHSSRRPRASSDRSGRGRPRRGGPARTPRPQRAEPHTELDHALNAAAAAPQPAAATFAELGLDPRLVRALAARDIREPFAIQARALPDALAGRDGRKTRADAWNYAACGNSIGTSGGRMLDRRQR